MIIILEGCDCTGKSTLARTLSDRCEMPIIHFGAPKNQSELSSMFDMYVTFLRMHNNVIMDRSWYSEMVYGPILRGSAIITEERRNMLEGILINKGCQIYWCYDKAHKIIDRLKNRGDDLITADMVPKILAGFDTVLGRVNKAIPVIKYKVPEVTINE